MSDENKQASTPDLQVLMAQFEQKMADREISFKKEMETQINQIHSSYAKKLKKMGVEDKVETEEGDETVSRKPTKREIELQDNLEKLVKEMEGAKTRAKQAEMKQSVSDQLLKSGINPKAVDTVYTLLQAKNAFVESEDGSLKLKVNVEGGANIALPVADALKHFMKTDEGQLFMAPSGAAGSGSKTPITPKNGGGKEEPLYKRVDVNWDAVASDMKFGE